MNKMPQISGWIVSGIAVTLVAVFIGLISALAPELAFLLSLLIIMLVIVGAGYALARRVANNNRQLALYLLLLWVWIVNMPAIVAFDSSGITKLDLFNPQSIGRIALFLLVGLLLVFNYFNTTRKQVLEKIELRSLFVLPLLIYGWYFLNAIMILQGQDLLLALYRIAEWALLLMLIYSVIRRAPVNPVERENWLLQVVFVVLLFMMIITLVLLPVAPSRVYFVGQSGVGRLGNPFAHPNTLGVIAGMAFFYIIERKPKHFKLGLIVSFGIMLATYSRGAWVGFAAATAFYLLLKPRTMHGRIFATITMIFLMTLGWVLQDLFIESVQRVLARGGSVSNLASASERTEVWKAARVLIESSPIFGHGYIAGPKKLNDIMASGVSAGYFRAVHAHNEFIQTQINAGILATLLLAAFLVRTLYLIKAMSKLASPQFFRCSTTWAIMLWSFGMLTPNISGQFLIVGALLLYLYIVLEMLYKERKVSLIKSARNHFGFEFNGNGLQK